jgi:uncharacterized protein YecT (DUF1311 family)
MQKFKTLLRPRLMAVVLFIFVSSGTFAQTSQYSETEVGFIADTVLAEARFLYCNKLDPSVAGMNLCLNKYIKEWETILNKYYEKLIPFTSGDMRSALVESQRNWGAYLDTEVALYGSMIQTQFNGGTPGNIVGSYKAGLIKERAIRMFHYYLFILD